MKSPDYYQLFFPKDTKWLKLLIYGLFLWDVAQTFIFTQSWFDPLAAKWGDKDALNKIGTSWFSVPFMSAVCECMMTYCGSLTFAYRKCNVASMVVQCFYAWRVWRLSHSKILAGLITAVRASSLSVVTAF
jgi:hypothetical protein